MTVERPAAAVAAAVRIALLVGRKNMSEDPANCRILVMIKVEMEGVGNVIVVQS